MTRPGPSVTSGADVQPGSDSLFPTGFSGGGALVRQGSVGTGEIADGSVAAADLNLASVAAAIATRSEFTGTYGPVAPPVLARKLLNQIRPMAQPDPFTVSADVPTVTAGTTATLTGRSVAIQGGEITEVGSRGTWNNTFGRLPVGGFCGLDFYHTGTAVEVEMFSGFTGNLPIWVFVDGQPITATYDTTTLTGATSGTSYFVKLVFGASRTRRIEFFAMHAGAWYRVRGNLGDVFTPAPRRPVSVWVGDSFWAGSNGSNYFDLPPFLVSRRLGFECFTYNTSFGGSGYTNAGTGTIYGSAARVSAAALANPDLLVFQGSVNDDGAAGIQAAVSAALAAYAASMPNALQVVLGPQPSNATDTIAVNRGTNANAVRAAALAGSRVVGFFDEIGVAATGTYPAAWSSGTTYNTGDTVTYKGSVWKANNGAGTTSGSGETPGASRRWQLLTWGYYGTGNTGAAGSDGTRDTVLYSDGVHPATAGQKTVFAPFTEKAIRDALAYYAANGAVLVG